MASEAATHAYAPYSGFHVGAAVVTEDGNVYLGANMENASYGATICAERVALSKALFDGHRKFQAIAVAALRKEVPEAVDLRKDISGGNTEDLFLPADEPAFPCGICRQFLYEFGAATRIVTGKDKDHLVTVTAGELLPYGFKLDIEKL
jgi:cytidine deaminase